MKKRILSMLLCMLMLVSLVPATASAIYSPDQPPSKYGNLGKDGKYIGLICAGGDLYKYNYEYYKISDFGDGLTYETVWPKLTSLIANGSYKGVQMYDPQTGTMYIAGRMEQLKLSWGSKRQSPYIMKIVVGGNGTSATMTNGILCNGSLDIELRGDLAITRYNLNLKEFDKCLGAIYVTTERPQNVKPTLTIRGSGAVCINYGKKDYAGDLEYTHYKNHDHQIAGISCDDAVFIKDDVSLYISSSKYSPMRAKSLSINTSGTVEMTSERKISDDNYYGIGNLYPVTARQITLSGPDEYKVLGTIGNQDAVSRIAETGSLKKALEQDADCKGWNIATKDGNPYTLTLTRPAPSISNFQLLYNDEEVARTGDTYTMTGAGRLQLQATANIPAATQLLVNRGKYFTALNTKAYPVTSLYKLNSEGKPTATVPLEMDENNRMQLKATLPTGEYMLRMRVAGILEGQIADVSDWTTYYINVNPIPKLTGSINFADRVCYGQDVTVNAVSGNVKQLQEENKLTYNWYKWSDSEKNWVIFKQTTTNVLPANYLNKSVLGDSMEFAASVTADGYRGEIFCESTSVQKAFSEKTPEDPTVNIAAPYQTVTIPNSSPEQEYMLCYTSSVPTDWTAAQKGNGGDLVLNAETNRTVYIYTRMAETDTTFAGTIYRYGYNFNGDYNGIADITISTHRSNLDYHEVTAVTVEPIPANATGWEDKLVEWYINGYDKNAIKLYKKAGSSQELEKDAYGNYKPTTLKTVYALGLDQTSYATLGAQVTLGYNDIRHAEMLMNVADADGRFRAFDVNLHETTLRMQQGESRNVGYTAQPEKGSMYGFKWELHRDSADGELVGTSGKELTFHSIKQLFTVNIPESLPNGVYYFVITIPNSSYKPTLRVEVGEQNIPIEKISANVSELNLLPNAKGKIEVDVSPNNAKGAADAKFKFESGNTGIAAVDQDGNITAAAPGKTEITIKLIGNEAVSTKVSVTVLAENPEDQPLPKPEPVPMPDPDDTAPESQPTNPFTDVPAGAYYEKAVLWAVQNGITNGTSDTTFSPDNTCTRAQAVTFLWRAAGCPLPENSTMPFVDVAADDYYYDAVLWAVENGITKGTSDTTFSPNQNCIRGQIVTLIWRSQNSPAAGSVNPFYDVAAGDYYYDAVLWAVKENVTNGTSATTFSPYDNCTRGQIVTFIYRASA